MKQRYNSVNPNSKQKAQLNRMLSQREREELNPPTIKHTIEPTSKEIELSLEQRKLQVNRIKEKMQFFNSKRPQPPTKTTARSNLNVMNMPVGWLNDDDSHW